MRMASYIKAFTKAWWASLLPSQRSAWHNFALAFPIVDWRGNFIVLNGWQMFNYCNSLICIIDAGRMLRDAPFSLDAPPPFDLYCDRTPARCLTGTGVSAIRGRAVIDVTAGLPAQVGVVGKGFYKPRNRPAWVMRPWGLSHSFVITPGYVGLIDAGVHSGWSPEHTERYVRVRIGGTHAVIHGTRAVCRLLCVSFANGQASEGLLLLR